MAQIQSGDSQDLLKIDPVAKAARTLIFDQYGNPMAVPRGGNVVATPTGIPMAGLSDSTYRVMRLDRLGSIRPGFDNLLLHDDVEGTTLNSQLWAPTVTTFTQAQLATTGIDFNSGNTLAANSNSMLISQKQFSKTQLSPLRMRMRTRVIPQTNALQEFGFGQPSGVTAQIANGAFWRYTAAGSVVPVIAFNSADTVQGTDISGLLNSANYYTWGIVVDDDSVFFTCQDVSTGQMISEQTLQIPKTQPKMWAVSHLPVFSRMYVTASAAPAAPKLFLADTTVVGLDTFVNKPWSHQVALANAGGAEINPTSFVQTANWANSTAPVSATLSNTAAGYTTLGGLFGFAAVAGAVTDYALFGFTVPVGYTFVCTGVDIDTYNTGAAVATTPTLLHWGVANNSSAISLAGTINRRHLGSQCLPVAAAIGQNATPISKRFDSPLRTEGGRIMQVILRMLVGTATASQIIQGGIDLQGYFE